MLWLRIGATRVSRGGGIFHESGTLSLRCTVVSNNVSAAYDGENDNSWQAWGANIFLYAGDLDLESGIVAGGYNQPGNGGAGVYLNSGTALVRNSSLARNNTQGLYNSSGTATATNSIFYFNSPVGGGLYGDQISGTADVTRSDVQNGYPGDGNIDVQPVFQGADAETDDTVIVDPSRCIDGGDPNTRDGWTPPGLGRQDPTDMGARGGPENCDWRRDFESLVLDIDPEDVAAGQTVKIRTVGAFPVGRPCSSSQQRSMACPPLSCCRSSASSSPWVHGSRPSITSRLRGGGVEFTIRTLSLDPNDHVVQSNAETVVLQ